MKVDYRTEIQLNLKEIIEKFNKSTRHERLNTAEVLPFISSKDSPHIRGRFSQVFGDYVRNICGLRMKKNDQDEAEYKEEVCNLIIKDIEFETSKDQENFMRFIKSFLFKENTIKPFHPYLFNYMRPDKYQNEMSKYGQFMYDIFIGSDNEIKDFFKDIDTDDLLTEIVLSKMDSTQLLPKEMKNKYQNLLPVLGQLYRKDIQYLSENRSYFLNSFPLLTHFYTFMYTCQLILKFDQFNKANFSKLDLFHFALDWESVSGRREAASGPSSFRNVNERSENLFPHIHAMSYLSHNTSNPKKNDVFPFMTYPELHELVSNGGDEVEANFVRNVNEWIINYSQLDWLPNKITVSGKNISLEPAFRELHGAFKQGMSEQSRKRYGAHVRHIGTGQFIKSRGSLGFVFNLTHDFILLLTAVSVKNDRIPLNSLFDEYEKRGITLDWRSKTEVIQFLDNLNFIDKKSDSGDAQYVKPIL